MSWGIWMIWEEYKPVFPGTDQHSPSVGKWIAAGATWCTTRGEPVLFNCEIPAALAAAKEWEDRRHAHPPFVIVSAKRYGVTSAGEILRCNVPDLSGLGGWMR